MHQRHLIDLPTFDGDSTNLNVVVESPCGSKVKFDYNPTIDAFELSYILPAGSHFPFEFGFVPSTLAEDGDPLDILVLMDAPSCVGCALAARPIGVIEAEQTQDGETFRNDRLIAVATAARNFAQVNSLDDLHPGILEEIEHFFISYNKMRRRQFKPLRRGDGSTAIALVRKAMRAYAKAHVPKLAHASSGR